MDRVMITGGTGFIGSHIVRAFCRRGVKPICLVRRSSDLENLKELDIEIRYGDVREKKTLIRAFENCNIVIHNAALVRDWGRYSDFYATNVRGTMNVMEAGMETGIRDIIMAGTNAVYGEENNLTIKDEHSPLNLPKAIVYPVAFIIEVLYSALGLHQPPLLTRGRVNLFYDNIEYSVRKSKTVLGHTNRHTLEQGIEITVFWYKRNHLV